jgi:hypothetical protein
VTDRLQDLGGMIEIAIGHTHAAASSAECMICPCPILRNHVIGRAGAILGARQ